MKLTLIGCGCGEGCLTGAARAAIDRAGLLIGAPRLLVPYVNKKKTLPAKSAGEIRAAIDANSGRQEEICILFSGDSGFYSGARLLTAELDNTEWELLPGISSLQMFAARLGEPWQSWRLCSAHGVDCDPVSEVCRGKKTFFLTGGKLGPGEICRELRDAGLGGLPVAIGEALGTDCERIYRGSAVTLADREYGPLSVLLADAAPRWPACVPGIPDCEFERADGVPMTKQEIRAAAISLLGISPQDVCWDIGAGTGSVAIELALQAKAVWGVERREDALQTAEKNRKHFGAWNLHLVSGHAPEILEKLPVPDAVFIGGSGGNLREILEHINAVNAQARVCMTAIALESALLALHGLKELGYDTEIRQISVSRGKSTGDLTMMLAQNPVFLITGKAT